ncbi:MAG TPA: PHP domain-containing protein [Clostridiales bacterium]|mgnify:CR=1 FL=1|uniref:PHP domain-containing protein n=1 Tax=Candidatus Egerieisoma faecipullorum TaxID=2840963 RepID=A0A9D1I808_9CLOT|nr:PHP domain-containing protein [Clostridiales bacterium]HIU29352.1 PHP domain-containing protein [Candidatus Egerieisoma faecipullorum]
MKKEELIEKLNDRDAEIRLASLRELMSMIDRGELKAPVQGNDVNNHIHTTFSFSPYSPTKAVWMAYCAGLKTAGIMDHDSLSGAREFIEAGKITGILTTIGVECRVSMKNTPLADKRINNPDQKGIAYTTIHGIPHQHIDEVVAFFKPYVKARNERNRKMTDRINALTAPYGIRLDFDRDVVPLSEFVHGGSITERHLLFALSQKLTERFGKGEAVISFLTKEMGIALPDKIKGYLSDSENPYYEYDLLGALKGNLVEKFYIDADEECPDVRELVAFAAKINAFSAYAYLGDVGDSVTGDKKTQKFEDDYLDQLFDVIKELKFKAVTYMPSRNTMEQLRRVRALCEKYGFFQISGEDINSPRQSFICEAQRNPEFANLYDSTMTLIRHETENSTV